MKPDWLPPLVLFESYNGDWTHYLEAIYALFKANFVDSKPMLRGVRLGLKRYPLTYNKEATFWHFIQEGQFEAERTPDLRRCERIGWPRAIENSQDLAIKCWKNERKGEKRICLWLEQEDYLVILAERQEYILPWTAYLVVQEHRQKKLQREYEAYQQKADAARYE